MPIQYTIQQGDCFSNVAFQNGFHPDTLWQHPDNATLRSQRKDMHVLLPGDVVNIPDLRAKMQSGATEKRHRFRRRGVPEKLQIQFFDEFGEAIASCACKIDIDGVIQQTQTDGEGRINVPIPPTAQIARIRFESSCQEWSNLEYECQLGGIDPVSEESGVRHRLENLQYLGPEIELVDALKAFQRDQGLQETGCADDATRAKLEKCSTV